MSFHAVNFPDLARRASARWNMPFGYKHVLGVALPLVASMASETLMLFVDRLFLSHYSVSSIAASLPAGSLAFAMQTAFIGICGYSSVFIAQHIGAHQPQHIGAILWQSLWISLIAGVFLAIAGICLADPVFALIGHAGNIAELESSYFRILLLGSFPVLLGSSFSAFFVGIGRTKPVLVANLAGVALNIPLDWILIFGRFGLPEAGISGAAIATLAGQIFSAILLGCLVFREGGGTSLLASWRPEIRLVLRLLRYGGPSGFNMLIDVAGFSWFILRLGRLGETALAASNIVLSINTLVFLPMMGLNSAVASLVGNAMGGRSPARAKTATASALHISLAYMTPLALSLVLGGEWYMDMFQPEGSAASSPEVRAAGVTLLWYVAAYSLVDSCNIIYFGALKGAGDTFFVMLSLTAFAVFLLGLPVFALEQLGLASLHSLWTTLSIYVVSLALLAWRRFAGGRWQEIRLVECEARSR
ncbi:MAG: MATE family efflux transporter [Desulfovibrio sp.]|jgi:MATE family multidrug resistance protein|nr:MATE family efflux transporter [Desulfovibrio sp.]